MWRQSLQTGHRTQPDVALSVLEQGQHRIAGNSIVDADRVTLALPSPLPTTYPPQSLSLRADPEVPATVVQQFDTPASRWRLTTPGAVFPGNLNPSLKSLIQTVPEVSSSEILPDVARHPDDVDLLEPVVCRRLR